MRIMVMVKRWLLAIVGRAPLGLNEGLVLVVTGGGTLVALAGLVPEPAAAAWQWGLWWIVAVASGLLLTRVLFSAASAGNRWIVIPIAWWIRVHSPYEIRSPIIHKATLRNGPPLGILDFEQATNRAVGRIIRILGGLTKDMLKATAMLQRFTPRFSAAKDASTGRKISLAREFASELDAFAGKFEGHQRRFRVERQKMIANSLPRLEAFTPDADDLVSLRDAIASMKSVTIESRQGMRNYRASVITMRGTNLHHTLNLAVDRLLAAVTELLVDYDATVVYATRALEVIEEKIPKAKPRHKKIKKP
jgi:hypothetical protein